MIILHFNYINIYIYNILINIIYLYFINLFEIFIYKKIKSYYLNCIFNFCKLSNSFINNEFVK